MIPHDKQRPLLFLDVDGVLNTHAELIPEVMCGLIHADKVKFLNMVLKHADAQFVLSSAWRYCIIRGEMTLAGMGWLLRSHGIWDRLCGMTRPDVMIARKPFGGTPEDWKTWPKENERGQQIADWLKAHEHAGPYAVVDDCDFGIKALHAERFVQTDPARGLTSLNVVQLTTALGGSRT